MGRVIGALSKFQMRSAEYSESSHQTLFILATPTFTSWLEESSEFIAKVLQRVVGITPSPTEINVICAAVDGLPPRPQLMQYQSGEGFSILLMSSTEKMRRIWEDTQADTTLTNMQSTLTFVSDLPTTTVVRIPLANTLFRNGRYSTLLLSRWRSSGDSFVISRQQVEKNNVNISVFGRLPKGTPRTYISTVPLTPVRQIKSGLGNIVRRIDFGDGDVGPASRELETSVTEYLAQQGHDYSTIDVWALIMPRDAFLGAENKSKEVLTITMDDVRAKWTASWTPDRRYVGDWIDKGATLCRVRKWFICFSSI
jgi:hypothetical protein